MNKNRPKFGLLADKGLAPASASLMSNLNNGLYDGCHERTTPGKSHVVLIQTAPGTWS